MKTDQIQKIIQYKNEERERMVVHTAEQLIDAIVKEQKVIAAAQVRIDELREDLLKLEVEQLSPKAVLGGE